MLGADASDRSKRLLIHLFELAEKLSNLTVTLLVLFVAVPARCTLAAPSLAEQLGVVATAPFDMMAQTLAPAHGMRERGLADWTVVDCRGSATGYAIQGLEPSALT